jgi:hypothetical protein
MLPITQIALLLVDWTDPSKIVYVCSPVTKLLGQTLNLVNDTARGMASNKTLPFILTSQLTSSRLSANIPIVRICPLRLAHWTHLLTCSLPSGDLRKTLIGLLSKLYLPEDDVEDVQIHSLLLLLRTLRSVSRFAQPIIVFHIVADPKSANAQLSAATALRRQL